MRNISYDLPVQPLRTTPVNNNKTKTSGANTENNAKGVTDVAAATTRSNNIPSLYEQNKQRMVLAQEMDKLMNIIMPDLGVQFRVHDSGQIITTVMNRTTDEVVREFPAEKILDIVHAMVQRLGIVTNVKY